MENSRIAFVCDRGGHLHDSLKLLEQLELTPAFLLTTPGPDVTALRKDPRFSNCRMRQVPQSFTWFGKKRIFDPFKCFITVTKSFYFVLKVRPKFVISTGAFNVVPFCLFAKLLGAKLIYIENLAQVKHASVTGKLLYPWADYFFVQWRDLLLQYGSKAKYSGWVL